LTWITCNKKSDTWSFK